MFVPLTVALIQVRQEEQQIREARLREATDLEAFLRSALVPGWGQHYKGHTKRGYVMGGLVAASLAYAAITDWNYRDARDAYAAAPDGTSQSTFSRLYDDYANKGDRADLALGIVGAVWLLNMIDAATQGANIEEPGQGVTLTVPGTGDGVGLVYHVRF
jgi:hypothetical protein